MGHILSEELRKLADQTQGAPITNTPDWAIQRDRAALQAGAALRRAADALDAVDFHRETVIAECQLIMAQRDELRRQLDVANLWASDLPSREWFDEQVARAERAEAIAREQTKFAQRAYEEKGVAEAERDELRATLKRELENIHDNGFHVLMWKERAERAEAQAARYREALEKIYAYRSDKPDWNIVMAIAEDAVNPMELVPSALRESETGGET